MAVKCNVKHMCLRRSSTCNLRLASTNLCMHTLDLTLKTNGWSNRILFVSCDVSTGKNELAEGRRPRLFLSVSRYGTLHRGTLEWAFVLVESPPLALLSSFDHLRLFAHFLTRCLTSWCLMDGQKMISGGRQKYLIHLVLLPLQGKSSPRKPAPSSRSSVRRSEKTRFSSDTERHLPTRSCVSPSPCTLSCVSVRPRLGSAPVDVTPCSCGGVSEYANPLSKHSHFRNEDNF